MKETKDFVVVITRRVSATSVRDAVDTALHQHDPSTRVAVWREPETIDEDSSVLWRGTLADVGSIKEESSDDN